MVINVLAAGAGILLLVFALPELFAQVAKVTIKLGPITYGPIPKIQVGCFIIYFKGIYGHAFLIVLILLIAIGIWLISWGVLTIQ